MSDLVPVTEALPEPTPTTVFDWLDASIPVVWAMERRTAEGRQRVGQALWLLRGMLPDGEYGQRVHTLAETHEVSERTLRNWRAEAERVLKLAPHEATTGHHRKQLPVPRPAETPLPTGRCETIAEQAQVAAVVVHTDWSRFPPERLDRMIEVLTRAKRAQAITTTETRKAVKATNGQCPPHEWKQRKGGPLGLTYICERCDARELMRPAELAS